MGTVEFSDRPTAERAIKMFDRSEFSGREIFVREDLPPPEKAPRDSYRDRPYRDGPPPPRYNDRYGGDRYGGERYGGDRNAGDRYGGDRYGREREREPRRTGPPQVEGFEIFVGNLPFSLRWQDLKDMFREFGDIERADVREGPGGRSKGFGTVVFRTQEAADAAIQKYDGYELMGRKVDVRHGKFSKSASAGNQNNAPSAPSIRTDGLSLNSELTLGVTFEGPNSNILFIGNLPWETAQSDLFELFGSITTITRAELQYGRGGRPNGNAVVEAENEESAQSIINQLNGYEYGNRNLKISFAKFPSEEELSIIKAEIEQNKAAADAAAAPSAAPSASANIVAEGQSAPFTNDEQMGGASIDTGAAPVGQVGLIEEVPQVEDADMIEE